jgi:hypothetical protein
VGYAQLVKTDAQCNELVSQGDGLAAGGTITIATISASGTSGSFALTFPGGAMMTGSFDAPVCAEPDAGASSPPDGGRTCLP